MLSRSRMFHKRACLSLAALGLIALTMPACDLAVIEQFLPPAPQDIRAVTLTLVNKTGITVRADAIFKHLEEEVRRSSRVLVPEGRESSVEILPTVVETLTIEAVLIGTENDRFAPGTRLIPKVLTLGKDFDVGDTLTFIILIDQILLNTAPQANLLPEFTVASGDVAAIPNNISDVDNDPIAIGWTQTSGPPVTVMGADTSTPTFVAPIVSAGQTQVINFKVVVSDPFVSTEGTTRALIVGPEFIDIALAARLPDSPENKSITLAPIISGGALPLTYEWRVIQAPPGERGQFVDPASPTTEWSPPAGGIGDWTFQIVVTDSQDNFVGANTTVTIKRDCDGNGIIDETEIAGGSATDCNTNTLIDSCDVAGSTSRDANSNGVPDECDPNDAPVAVIDAPTSVQSGEAVTLDGSRSSDSDEGPLQYQWTQIDGPTVVGGDSQLSTYLFQAPLVPAGQFITLQFQLVVTDVLGASNSTTATVLVVGPVALEVSVAAMPTAILTGGTTTLSATVTGGVEPYTYLWNTADAPDGQMGTFSAPDQPTTDWTAPDVNIGIATLRVVVNDAEGNAATGEVFVTLTRDCNTNGTLDSIEIAEGAAQDCDSNGAPDECDIGLGDATDCDGDSIPDVCQLAGNDCNTDGTLDRCENGKTGSPDCNENGRPDQCDLADGTLHDCNSNRFPDECEDLPDCDQDGTPDECEIGSGTDDCNTNDVPDDCDIAGGQSGDCDTNSKPDECDIADGRLHDCEPNGIPNECEPGWMGDCNTNLCPPVVDCNTNLVDDLCDVILQTSRDCNSNLSPDECEIADGSNTDCNENLTLDTCEPGLDDCNTNQVPDVCDLAGGQSQDCQANGRPDECELSQNDCNTNLMPDDCDIAAGQSFDCNQNGRPDECELFENDCNTNSVPDDCELAVDCDTNGSPDACDVALADCNENRTPDACDPDCDTNGTPDNCESFFPDCNDNGIPDVCDAVGNDCNTNGTPDECDLGGKGGRPDCNTNNVPDECDLAQGLSDDCNTNFRLDECDINFGEPDINENGIPDVCESGAACLTCQGDTNGDNRVDGGDLAGFIECVTNQTNCACTDLDGDNMTADVDPDDIALLVLRLLTGEATDCPPP